MRVKLILVSISLFALHIHCFSQKEMELWPEGVPNEIKNDTVFEETTTGDNGIVRVKYVKTPNLKLFLPEKDKATGAAVIICPGGGYSILAIDHEGYKVAEWLKSIGVAGIVLKYRLPEDFLMTNKEIVPLMDAQQAIRMVRKNASQWNIDPHKIGIMGFSAGGHLASTATTHFNQLVGNIIDTTSVRPDFSVLIYPVVSFQEFGHSWTRYRLLGDHPTPDEIARFSNELWVTEDTPPVFLVHSTNDTGVPVENSIRFYQQCVKNNVPAAMHIFETGKHGYGMGRPASPEGNWPQLFEQWMRSRQIIK